MQGTNKQARAITLMVIIPATASLCFLNRRQMILQGDSSTTVVRASLSRLMTDTLLTPI